MKVFIKTEGDEFIVDIDFVIDSSGYCLDHLMYKALYACPNPELVTEIGYSFWNAEDKTIKTKILEKYQFSEEIARVIHAKHLEYIANKLREFVEIPKETSGIKEPEFGLKIGD
jgi:hypothetical protein